MTLWNQPRFNVFNFNRTARVSVTDSKARSTGYCLSLAHQWYLFIYIFFKWYRKFTTLIIFNLKLHFINRKSINIPNEMVGYKPRLHNIPWKKKCKQTRTPQVHTIPLQLFPSLRSCFVASLPFTRFCYLLVGRSSWKVQQVSLSLIFRLRIIVAG